MKGLPLLNAHLWGGQHADAGHASQHLQHNVRVLCSRSGVHERSEQLRQVQREAMLAFVGAAQSLGKQTACRCPCAAAQLLTVADLPSTLPPRLAIRHTHPPTHPPAAALGCLRPLAAPPPAAAARRPPWGAPRPGRLPLQASRQWPARAGQEQSGALRRGAAQRAACCPAAGHSVLLSSWPTCYHAQPSSQTLRADVPSGVPSSIWTNVPSTTGKPQPPSS